MSGVVALGYVVLSSPDLEQWRDFASGVLGLQAVSPSADRLLLRCDERTHRIQIDRGPAEALAAMGWEVASEQELGELADRLRAAGHPAERGEPALAESRRVSSLVVTADPDGNRVELYHGLAIDQAPFVSPTGARFVTDPMGFGHAFASVADVPRSRAFYVDLLGMKVSDRMPFGEHDAYFLRCNPRHHSLGMAHVPGLPARLLHLMFEVDDLDVIGRSYFDGVDRGIPLTTTLGRHSNDRMFSFYVRSPGGFDIEYGFGGLTIDEADYVEKRVETESFWGHRRTEFNVRGAQTGAEL